MLKKIGVLFFLSSCAFVPLSLQDNILEEEMEDYIYEKSGMKVDFSGDSAEKS